LYQQKHYARDNNQDEDSRAPKEECAVSDEDDWKIDMSDGDEIDDIEENNLDDELQCPRTRLQLSC
jgi:hypothetical protein